MNNMVAAMQTEKRKASSSMEAHIVIRPIKGFLQSGTQGLKTTLVSLHFNAGHIPSALHEGCCLRSQQTTLPLVFSLCLVNLIFYAH